MSREAEIKRRVKVFSFSDRNVWEDMGTGFVSKDYIEVTRGEVLTITVRSEDDDSIIIQSKVLPERSYKMQEGTMIIWTENSSCDLALSFQEKVACDELWIKICEVQGHLSEDGDLSDRFDDSWSLPELPPCELSKLDDIQNLIATVAPFPERREHLALCIEKEGYIAKLLDLFHICEDLENMDGLHHLYEIFKAFFMFNSASLLQILFQEDTMMDVIGCLEYCPRKPEPTSHRNYLSKISTYREVVKFNSTELLTKIHQTYKVQYIQEVILPTPSLFEENLMSALNSFILFNKTEIINMIQEDQWLLKQLFEKLRSDSTPESEYRQLVSLLREISMFSLALENVDRTKFFLKLDGFGFMSAVEGMLMYENVEVVSAAVDILILIAEFNSSILRDHTLQTQDTASEDNQFLNIIISLLVDGEFTDIDVQLVGLIKSLINPENIAVDSTALTSDKTLFLKYFYNNCMPRLMAPLMAQTSSDTISNDTPQNAVLLSHILDILSLCVRMHTYHIRNYIIDKNILSRVLVLMMSSHGHLVLASLRFCRRIIGLKDKFYNRYVIYKNLFCPIVKVLVANGRRYNLINSAILELFEFIRMENIKPLVSYTVENFMSILEAVDYVSIFRDLKLKHEQEKDAKENIQKLLNRSLGNVVVQTRYKRDPRQMDEEEEAWFDEEDEEDEYVPFNANSISTPTASTPPTVTITTPISSTSTTPLSTTATPTSQSFVFTSSSARPSPVSPHTPPTSTTPASLSYSPRPLGCGSRVTLPEAKVVPLSPLPTISAALQSLVEYDEDSDEDTPNSDETSAVDTNSHEGGETAMDEMESPSPTKRQKLD